MRWLLVYVGIIWTVEAVNTVVGHRLDDFGIVPRTTVGLKGIVFGPFLHSGFGHVISNTVPLVILGSLVAVTGRNTLLGLSGIAALVGGLAVWLFGRHGVHIGASSLVFGYFGYLVARGWYERTFVSTIISLVVLVFYGGMIFAAMPFMPSVSWEGHLSGLISGVVYGRLSRQRGRQSKS